jgi:hypothetical protein
MRFPAQEFVYNIKAYFVCNCAKGGGEECQPECQKMLEKHASLS